MNATFAQPVGADTRYLTDIKTTILDAARNAPRTQQRSLGPSEVGDPCARKLAYKLLDVTPTNTTTDPLPSLVGTGAHAWLADAFAADNQRLGRQRWVIEQRLQCGDVSGSGDLYDADTYKVIDHKFPGATAMKKYKTNGPSQVYRVQAHLYGLGHVNAGRRVDDVAILFFPRGGMLSDAWLWQEPYQPDIAQQALDRLHSIAAAIDAWMSATGGDKSQTLAAIPTHVTPLCNWCHYLAFASSDLSTGCPGEATHTEINQQKGSNS